MPLTDEIAADVEAFAVPELAVEFADTLCRFWIDNRANYTTAAVPEDALYMMLDSLASVVLGGPDSDAC